jgi:flavin-dependent dehydrogenase
MEPAWIRRIGHGGWNESLFRTGKNAAVIADAVVFGGGPAGAAVAIKLASLGRQIVLLERRSVYANAGEVLSPEIRNSLQHLGIWEDFLSTQPKAAHGIWSAWGSDRPLARDFIGNPYGPGWCVDRRQFDRLLLAAAERAGVLVVNEFDKLEVRHADHSWCINNRRSGQEALSIEARFAVDATGRTGALARAAGVRRRNVDCLVALIATLAAPRATAECDDVLLIESVPMGWWYSTTLPEGDLVAAFMTDSDFVQQASCSAGEMWSSALRSAPLTESRTEGYERRSFKVRDARSGALDRAGCRDWVAVGDAASTIDPLSGRGVTRAMQSAFMAAKAADDALSGNPAALESYAARSQADFEAALRVGSSHYVQEQRWPESPFWKRRRI